MVRVDPEIQRQYDRVAAEHRAAGAAIAAELRARRRDIAERVRARHAGLAAPAEEDDEVPGFQWDEV